MLNPVKEKSGPDNQFPLLLKYSGGNPLAGKDSRLVPLGLYIV
jgi:hypothetical protein